MTSLSLIDPDKPCLDCPDLRVVSAIDGSCRVRITCNDETCPHRAKETHHDPARTA